MREKGLIGGAAALLVAIGLAARLWHVGAEPLWLDEAYSAYAADHGFWFIWHVAPRYEAHPPLYYTLLKLWTLPFGDGLIALRALGLAAGVLTVPLVVAAADEAGRELGWEAARRRRLRFAALAFACVSLPLVEMARQVRPYPIMVLGFAAATWALLRLARRAREGAPVGGGFYLAYLALLEAMLWLHNMGPLYGVAMTLALAIAVVRKGCSRRDWAWLASGHVAVALLYLPALAMLLDQAGVWKGSTWLRFNPASLPERLPVLYAAPGAAALAGLVLAGLGAWKLSRSWKGGRLLAILLSLSLVPVALAILLSLTVTPVFITRVLSPVAVPTLVLFAIATLGWTDRRRWVALGAALFLGFNMAAVDLQARQGGPMQDWYGTVAWLKRHVRPGDEIFAYPNEGALPLARALADKGLTFPIRPIPVAVPAFDPTGWHPTGYRAVTSLPRWRLRQIAEGPQTKAVPTIWLLRLGASTYDPGDAFLDELHRGRHIVRSWLDGPIDIIGLARDPRSPPAPVRNRR